MPDLISTRIVFFHSTARRKEEKNFSLESDGEKMVHRSDATKDPPDGPDS